jgi:hypothetical protein
MHLLNSLNQNFPDRAYRADGVLANTSPKLILPQAVSRAFLRFQNIGTNPIYLDHGCARATATLTNGVVTGLTILNAGFGLTRPPIVQFKGGGGQYPTPLTASGWDGRGQIDNWPTPSGVNVLVTPPVYSRIAKATAVLTSGAVSSFVISDGGAGYLYPPEVMLTNDPLDPFGCADPSAGGGSGMILNTGNTYELNGTFCHTDAVAVFAAAGSASYYLEYAP